MAGARVFRVEYRSRAEDLPLHSSSNQILLNGLAVSAALIAAPFSARNAVSIGEYGTMCDTLKCNTMHTKLLPESIKGVEMRRH